MMFQTVMYLPLCAAVVIFGRPSRLSEAFVHFRVVPDLVSPTLAVVLAVAVASAAYVMWASLSWMWAWNLNLFISFLKSIWKCVYGGFGDSSYLREFFFRDHYQKRRHLDIYLMQQFLCFNNSTIYQKNTESCVFLMKNYTADPPDWNQWIEFPSHFISNAFLAALIEIDYVQWQARIWTVKSSLRVDAETNIYITTHSVEQ